MYYHLADDPDYQQSQPVLSLLLFEHILLVFHTFYSLLRCSTLSDFFFSFLRFIKTEVLSISNHL